MKPYKDTCKVCGQSKWISNARYVCRECCFKESHNGLSRLEVARQKQKDKPVKKTVIRPSTKRFDVLLRDRETYKAVFDSKPNICEECGVELPDEFLDIWGNIVMISQYSHILGKSAYPEHRHNPINFNRLCPGHHDMWENRDRTKMKIYEGNQLIINNLLSNKVI